MSVATVSFGRAYVQMTTSGSVTLNSSGTRVPLTFDTKVSDNSGFWSAAANTKLTIPTSGDYLAFYTCPAGVGEANSQSGSQVLSWPTTGSNPLFKQAIWPAFFQIRKNGDNSQVFAGTYGEGYSYIDSTGHQDFLDIGPHANGTAILSLLAGDYLELVAWQNYSGSTDSSFTYPPSVTASQVPSFGIVGPLDQLIVVPAGPIAVLS